MELLTRKELDQKKNPIETEYTLTPWNPTYADLFEDHEPDFNYIK